jgi:hypothetical protein
VIKTKRKLKLENADKIGRIFVGDENPALFMVANTSLVEIEDFGFIHIYYVGYTAPTRSLQSDPKAVITYPGVGTASRTRPLRYVFRFPQQGQDADKLKAGLASANRLLRETRAYWRN